MSMYTLRHVVSGAARGRAILSLHGLMGSAADWYRQPLARREGLVQAMIEARSNNGPDARSAAVPEAGRNVRVEAHEAYLDLLKGFLRSLYNPLHD